MFSPSLVKQAQTLITLCKQQGRKITTAESCTGGLIAGLITEIAGASAIFEQGFVTYSNASKQHLLGVSEALLSQYGAVSEQVAAQMAEGALAKAKAEIAVAVTGIAGPDGGTPQKPVGLVYIAVAAKEKITKVQKFHFTGSRSEVRLATVKEALTMIEMTC